MKHRYLYILISVSIVLAIGYLYHSVVEVKNEITDKIGKVYSENAGEFAANAARMIEEEVPGPLYATLRADPVLRNRLERALSLLANPTYRYIYLLRRDRYGDFRYLLDGSMEDRGDFDARLNVDKKRWERAFNECRTTLFTQRKLETLFATLLRPVKCGPDGAEGVLAIDFSTRVPSTIQDVIGPVERTFLYVFIAIALLLLAVLWQSYLNYKVEREKETDPLTGLYNRAYLRKFLKKFDPHSYQVVMMDIDHFKMINDNYGHKTGDAVLAETARIIRRSIRENDIAIRYGGEEFLLFIEREKENDDFATEVAERIRHNIAEHRFIVEESGVIDVSISGGVTLDTTHFKTPVDAIRHADELLYRAKHEGRNRIVSSSDHLPVHQDVTINDVKQALMEGRIVCHYQPVVDLRTNEPVKYEALVRLEKDDGEVLAPNAFLEMIMYTSVYNELTRHVIMTVFEAIERHSCPISFNLNFSDLLDNVTFEMIVRAIESRKELTRWLTVELLENEKGNETVMKERVERLKSLGVTIALDDFGSGYANFDILQFMPIDILKIDGSLIKNLAGSQKLHAVVKTVKILGDGLGMECIAEFVHDEATYNAVRELGITYGQGYFLGKPAPEIESCR
ncbi:bifunctional diguanylate cyclase/phosphodiesterase [Hydrogenimonas sp. SS33]|uniref:bifunctional diguanylate cyclase/phosphodiesterase n=1 Tax=Hydrogenimonas leucolamina TaxID=2954236 RepID=UPI00336C0E3A